MTCLTEKESNLLKSISEGMDEPGCGWLHEIVEVTPSTKGVLGSLIKKNMVRSTKEITPGYPTAYWVELIV